MKTINTILSFLALVVSVLALSIVVTNAPSTGSMGPSGNNGVDGTDGLDGEDGEDGNTPYIGSNGNWWINGQDTGVIATPGLEPISSFDDLSFAMVEQASIMARLSPWLTNEGVEESDRSVYLASLSNEGYTVIDSAAELMSLSDRHGKYVLGLDIDLSTLSSWQPISFGDFGFSGTLDGAGFSISGLNSINLDPLYPDTSYLGLFSWLDDATIRNVHINEFELISTGNEVGTLAGYVEDSSLSFITISESVVNGLGLIGGLVGSARNTIFDDIYIESIEVKGSVVVGGIVGFSSGSSIVQSSTTIATHIEVDREIGGGFAGEFNKGYALMSASYSFVSFSGNEVTANYAIGGFFGIVENTYLMQLGTYASVSSFNNELTSHIEFMGGVAGLAISVKAANIYSTSHVFVVVNASDYFYEVISLGGVFGEMQQSLLYNTIHLGTVKVIDFNNIDDESIYPFSEYLGGLVGYLRYSGRITASAHNGTVRGAEEIGGILGGTGFAIEVGWSTLEIEQSTNWGSVVGVSLVGGLVGSIEGFYNVEIHQSYNQGSVEGESAIGGLLGMLMSYAGLPSSIRDSYNSGTLKGVYGVGGLVGASFPNYETQEFGNGYLNIERSFNVGSIISLELGFYGANYEFNQIGAIIGARYLGGTHSMVSYRYLEEVVELYEFNGENKNVYDDALMILPSAGYGMDADMFAIQELNRFKETNFLYSSLWNFRDVWSFNDEKDYPELKQNIVIAIYY